MAITAECICGKRYDLKDEYAGQEVSCPECGEVIRVPDAVVPMGDPVFARDKYLLRQKALAISEKYMVWDEQGREILFIKRPAHFFRNLFAALAAIVAALFVLILCMVAAFGIDNENPPVALLVIGILFAIPAFGFTMVALYKKRHVAFYRDSTESEILLSIFQEKKMEILTATYTVTDQAGTVLGRLRKNHLYNLYRKRWQCYDRENRLLCLAIEDSLILSLLRRFLGTFFGLLRVNFIFIQPETRQVIGEFNRKFTLLDRYALDMSADSDRVLDRRMGLALGVMLDSGEKR